MRLQRDSHAEQKGKQRERFELHQRSDPAQEEPSCSIRGPAFAAHMSEEGHAKQRLEIHDQHAIKRDASQDVERRITIALFNRLHFHGRRQVADSLPCSGNLCEQRPAGE